MNKHTPGPWFYGICYEPEKGPIPIEHQSPGYYDNPAIMGANGEHVVGCSEYNVFQNKSDIALLTAAPELLEALKDALLLIETLTPMDGDTCRKARAAIAKAEGESCKS